MLEPVAEAAGQFGIVFDQEYANDNLLRIQGNAQLILQLIFRFQSAYSQLIMPPSFIAGSGRKQPFIRPGRRR
jgi:hypothetical protein